MAPRQTQSGSNQEPEQPGNLVEPEGVAEQREQELKDAAQADVPDAAEGTPEQQYKSSHVPGSPESAGHPGYFPDQYTRDHVVYGHFCVVTEGEHEGLYGVYIDNVTSDDKGRPERVIVRERNTGRMVAVNYDDIAPASPGDVGRGRP